MARSALRDLTPDTPNQGISQFDIRNVIQNYAQPKPSSLAGIQAQFPDSTPTEQEVYRMTGMQPGLDRAMLLPVSGSRSEGNLDWAAPGVLYDAAKMVFAPKVAMSGRQVSDEETMNIAMNLLGGGVGASHLAGPVREAGSEILGMAVKNKGGNWLPGHGPEQVTGPLRSGADVRLAAHRAEYPPEYVESMAQRMDANPPEPDEFTALFRNDGDEFRANTALRESRLIPDASVDNWIGTKLNKYIQNEMGTPQDPILELANRGTLHYTPDPFRDRGGVAAERRGHAGFPIAGTYPDSELARNWEGWTDGAIKPYRAGELIDQHGYSDLDAPWMSKIDPNTPVYTTPAQGFGAAGAYGPPSYRALGFDHLVDELRNAVNPESGLPQNLLINPNKLDRITVPQMVEHVAKINKWRVEQKTAADLARANNAATHVIKEYPETNLKWAELRMPDGETDPTVLQAALKYEGDTMGHCVGGYCDSVASGETKIYSLRDVKGEPHVTIEVGPPTLSDSISRGDLLNEEQKAMVRKYASDYSDDQKIEGSTKILADAIDSILGPAPDKIIQIKGKGNAKPADKYLPAVQDFVRTGNWSRVGDLQNSGLYSAKDVVDQMPHTFTMSRNAKQLAIGRARQANDLPDYMTMPEYEAMLLKHAPEDIWKAEKAKMDAESDKLLNDLQAPPRSALRDME